MFLGVAIETNNFALEVIVILGFENIHPGGHVAKIGLNGSIYNRVKVQKLFWGLLI